MTTQQGNDVCLIKLEEVKQKIYARIRNETALNFAALAAASGDAESVKGKLLSLCKLLSIFEQIRGQADPKKNSAEANLINRIIEIRVNLLHYAKIKELEKHENMIHNLINELMKHLEEIINDSKQRIILMRAEK